MPTSTAVPASTLKEIREQLDSLGDMPLAPGTAVLMLTRREVQAVLAVRAHPNADILTKVRDNTIVDLAVTEKIPLE